MVSTTHDSLIARVVGHRSAQGDTKSNLDKLGAQNNLIELEEHYD
jgi:hypothetical protein